MAPSTVLLIDSDQDSITIYSLFLRHHGYTVEYSMDGATGLSMAFEMMPNIVVSELFLPYIEVNSLMRGLRADARTAATPLILLDSIPMLGEKLVEEQPHTSRLVKPCEPGRLLREVGRLLGR